MNEWVLDEHGTQMYRRVFGPDVLDYAMLPDDDVQRAIRDAPRTDGELLTAGQVLLVFKNGRKVRLWTSEWGGVEVFDEAGDRP